MKTTNYISRLLAALLFASGLFGMNVAVQAAEQHSHDHAPAAVKPLAKGQRWATDAPLREAMTHIRADFAAQLKAVHKDKLTAEQYKELAHKTEAQVGNIVANCKLPADADAALHGILAQIGEGTEAMAGKSKVKPRDGAVKIVTALDEYGRTFDHPGWKKLH